MAFVVFGLRVCVRLSVYFCDCYQNNLKTNKFKKSKLSFYKFVSYTDVFWNFLKRSDKESAPKEFAYAMAYGQNFWLVHFNIQTPQNRLKRAQIFDMIKKHVNNEIWYE